MLPRFSRLGLNRGQALVSGPSNRSQIQQQALRSQLFRTSQAGFSNALFVGSNREQLQLLTGNRRYFSQEQEKTETSQSTESTSTTQSEETQSTHQKTTPELPLQKTGWGHKNLQQQAKSRQFLIKNFHKMYLDPEKPRRVRMPYFVFMMDYRAKFPYLEESQKPIEAHKAYLERCQQQWKNESNDSTFQEMRKSQEQKYEKEHQEYSEKIRVYKESGREEFWRRDPAKPKGVWSQYRMWQEEHLVPNYTEAEKKMTMLERNQMMAKKFNTDTTDQIKDKYNAMHDEQRKKYALEVQNYIDSGKEAQYHKETGLDKYLEAWDLQQDQAKEKERLQKEKEKRKVQLQKERAQLKKLQEQQKQKVAKDKQKQKQLKEKEKQKLQQQKEKEKARKEKEKLKKLK